MVYQESVDRMLRITTHVVDMRNHLGLVDVLEHFRLLNDGKRYRYLPLTWEAAIGVETNPSLVRPFVTRYNPFCEFKDGQIVDASGRTLEARMMSVCSRRERISRLGAVVVVDPYVAGIQNALVGLVRVTHL